MDSLVVITSTKGHVHVLLLWSYWLVNCNANGDNQIYISYIIMFHILHVLQVWAWPPAWQSCRWAAACSSAQPPPAVKRKTTRTTLPPSCRNVWVGTLNAWRDVKERKYSVLFQFNEENLCVSKQLEIYEMIGQAISNSRRAGGEVSI